MSKPSDDNDNGGDICEQRQVSIAQEEKLSFGIAKSNTALQTVSHTKDEAQLCFESLKSKKPICTFLTLYCEDVGECCGILRRVA